MFTLGDAQLRPIAGFPWRVLSDGVRKRILGGLKRFLFGLAGGTGEAYGPAAPGAANDPA